jgi:hypothetical protein
MNETAPLSVYTVGEAFRLPRTSLIGTETRPLLLYPVFFCSHGSVVSFSSCPLTFFGFRL